MALKKLPLTPFSAEENSMDYTLTPFKENNMFFTILAEVEDVIHRFDEYRFGVLTTDNKYFWFFNGKAVAPDRDKAIVAFQELKEYCHINNVGTPFAYKPGVKK